MQSIFSSNFLLRPWCTSTPFYSKRARYFVHLSDSSLRDILKRSIFFTDETKKVVSTCLRLETDSNIYYFWKFTMQSIPSSNCVLQPWCSSTPFCPERARSSVHLSDSPNGDILKRSNFFIGEIKNVVLTCLRLETRFNIHYFWSFIMHSKSSSNFFCCPGAVLLHFILREQDILFIWVIHPWRNFWKEAIFSQLRPRLVLFCLRLETGSNIYYSWNFTMHSIISSNCVCCPGALLLRFTLREQGLLFISVIHPRGIFWKEAIFFIDETKEVVLTCLRSETRSKIHYSWSFTTHSISSAIFFCCPGALLLHFTLREQDILFISKKVVLTCLRLETRSNIHYFWSFTMHSLSSSTFLLRPRCNCTPFYYLREQDFLFISVNHPRVIF